MGEGIIQEEDEDLEENENEEVINNEKEETLKPITNNNFDEDLDEHLILDEDLNLDLFLLNETNSSYEFNLLDFFVIILIVI